MGKPKVKTFGRLIGSYALTGNLDEQYELYESPDGQFILVSPDGKTSKKFASMSFLFDCINELTLAAETREKELKPKLVK